MRSPRILMCPPDYYGIEYEINPWMSRARGSTPERAREQWRHLESKLRSLGVELEFMTPQPGLPDLVFTANAGLVFRNRFFSSAFKHDVRALETPHFDAWFSAHGYTVEHLPDGVFFEGAGDALFCGPKLFAGYRIRSDAAAHQFLAKAVGVQVLPLELIDPRFYHLDTCFCPLSPTEALWFPAAFDAYGQKVVRNHVPTLIDVVEEEAARFACNAVVVGKSVVLNAGSVQLTRDLESRGYQCHPVELDEFIKAGGSAKCLTIRLDGEDAASWAGGE